jgi:autotransporter-associated beta strand protein
MYRDWMSRPRLLESLPAMTRLIASSVRSPRPALLAIALLAVSLLTSPAFGQTATWNGGNNGQWNANPNWSPSGQPMSPTTIVLSNSTITANATINMNGSRSAGNVTMNATSFDYFMSGNPGNQLNLNVPSGTPFIDVVSANRTLTIVSGNGLGGSQGFEKRGAGELDILGQSEYTGTTILTAGTLKIGTSTSLGVTNPLTVNGGTLDLNGQSPTFANFTGTGGTITSTSATNRTLTIGGNNGTGGNYQGLIQNGSGTTSLTKIGTGTIALSGANTYTGATLVNGGTLQIGGGGTTGSLSTSSAITTNATLAFNRSNTVTQGTDFNSVIGGTGGVSQVGTGTLVLNGNNTFSGTLAVTQGTIQVATLNSANTVGPLGNGSLAIQMGGSGTTGTLEYTGGSITTNRTFTAVSGGTGRFNVTNAATTLTLAGPLTPTGNMTLAGPGSYTITAPLDVAGTGTVTKNGSGTLRLSGAGGHSGALVINEGTFIPTVNGAFNNMTSLTLGSGVILDNPSSNTVAVANTAMTKTLGSSLTFLGSGSPNANLTLGQGATTLTSNITFNVAANALNFFGNFVGGDYSFTKIGNGTLRFINMTGNNAFTGNSTVSAGTFRIAGNSTWLGSVYIASGARIEVDAFSNVSGGQIVLAEGATAQYDAVVNTPVVFAGNRTLTVSDTLVNGSQTINSNVAITSVSDRFGTDPGVFTPGRIVMEDNASIISSGNIVLNANKGVTLNGTMATFSTPGGTTISINPQVAGTGKLIKTGTGEMAITSTANTYAGGTDILEGSLGIFADGSLGAGGTNVFIASGAAFETAFGIGNGTATVAANRTINLANGGSSNINALNTSTLVINSLVTGTGAGSPANLLINEPAVHEGTVVLAGANTYGGTTTVTAGTLLVNNTSGSATGTGNVIVNSGATFGGSGSIAGDLTILSGGTLSPGNSIESLGAGNTTWNGSSTFVFEFDTDGDTGTAGTNWDLLTVTGALDLSGASNVNQIIFDLFTMSNTTTRGSLASWDPNEDHIWSGFVTTTGGITGFSSDKFNIVTTGFQNSIAPEGSFSVVQSGNNLDLVYVAVPEPPMLALLAAGGLAGCVYRMRTRKRLA